MAQKEGNFNQMDYSKWKGQKKIIVYKEIVFFPYKQWLDRKMSDPILKFLQRRNRKQDFQKNPCMYIEC